MRFPCDGRRYGFMGRAMVFGSVADAIRYNVFHRLAPDVFEKLFRIPPLRFFGDFGAAPVPWGSLKQL